MAGAATSQRTAAVPAKAPGAARLSLLRRVQELPARTLARNLQVLPGLVTWLANYHSLFSARCHICRKILVRPPTLLLPLIVAISSPAFPVLLS